VVTAVAACLAGATCGGGGDNDSDDATIKGGAVAACLVDLLQLISNLGFDFK
jgi:hypothetical protein